MSGNAINNEKVKLIRELNQKQKLTTWVSLIELLVKHCQEVIGTNK